MQILNIILTIMVIIANAVMTYFVITAWLELRRLKRDINGMRRSLAVTTAITMGEHIKSSFDQLNEMKAAFLRLVEDERFEEAERLKAAITNAERNAKAAMKHFKDICGDSCEIIVEKVKSHIDEEDL